MFTKMSFPYLSQLNFSYVASMFSYLHHIYPERIQTVCRSSLSLELWHLYTLGSHFIEIMEKDFIHNLRSMINGEFRHAIDQFGWTFFKAVEVEGTGFISLAEYRNLQEAWHVGRGEAEGMFKVSYL